MAKTHKPITEELPKWVNETYPENETPAAETSDLQLKYAPTFDVQKLRIKCPQIACLHTPRKTRKSTLHWSRRINKRNY